MVGSDDLRVAVSLGLRLRLRWDKVRHTGGNRYQVALMGFASLTRGQVTNLSGFVPYVRYVRRSNRKANHNYVMNWRRACRTC